MAALVFRATNFIRVSIHNMDHGRAWGSMRDMFLQPPSPHHDKRRLETPTSSSSFSTTLRSLCPTIVQSMWASFNCSTLNSPVKAPLGLSYTFWAATPILEAASWRTRRRYNDGGAMTSSVAASSWDLLRWVTIVVTESTNKFLLQKEKDVRRSPRTIREELFSWTLCS